jgi:hypothetical protein
MPAGLWCCTKASGLLPACFAPGESNPPMAWPKEFKDCGDALELELSMFMSNMQLERASMRLMKFAKESWCCALSGQRRLLALLHPFAPAATWWMDKRLRKLACQQH